MGLDIKIGEPEKINKVDITVDGEDWGEAYQVNGQWWIVFEQEPEEMDLTYIGTANTAHEIMRVVAHHIEEET